MAKKGDDRDQGEGVISIVGPGMRVVGDCETEGTVRVEGRVEGSITAGKAVVIGKDGIVVGDVVTQDAVVGGTLRGTLVAESRLELQSSCRVEGDIRARRMQLEEGAVLNGEVEMGDDITAPARSAAEGPGEGDADEGAGEAGPGGDGPEPGAPQGSRAP